MDHRAFEIKVFYNIDTQLNNKQVKTRIASVKECDRKKLLNQHI